MFTNKLANRRYGPNRMPPTLRRISSGRSRSRVSSKPNWRLNKNLTLTPGWNGDWQLSGGVWPPPFEQGALSQLRNRIVLGSLRWEIAIDSSLCRWLPTCNLATGSALTAMTSTTQEKAFLRVAVAAIPRVTELIQRFPPDDQAGALETAERSFRAAALDYGCTEIAAQSRASALMRRLRSRLERQQGDEKKLRVLLHKLTKSG